jgi:predicted regulator of Ras-like GTPase activity (Roadblock/LC7/MglB family)
MYQTLLEQLVKTVSGANAAVLLDVEGEVVVEAGAQADRDRHRLIGAYQGLMLAAMRRFSPGCDLGPLDYMIRRHRDGTIILRPLKDNYYFVLCLAPDAPTALGIHHSARTQKLLNEEL